MKTKPDGILENGALKPALLIIYKWKTDTEILMDGGTLPYGGIIKLTAETTKQDHREFKTFGLVNCHNSYGVLVFPCHLDLPHRNLFFLDSINITHEPI